MHRSFETALIFFFCITITMNFSSQFCKSEVQQNMTGFSALGITRLKTSWAEFMSGNSRGNKICFPSYFWCWQNSIPCGCRTEVLVSLLAVSQRSLSANQRLPMLLITGPCPTRSVLPIVLRLQISDFLSLRPPDPDSRAQGISSGLHRYFLCLKVNWFVKLLIFSKNPFCYNVIIRVIIHHTHRFWPTQGKEITQGWGSLWVILEFCLQPRPSTAGSSSLLPHSKDHSRSAHMQTMENRCHLSIEGAAKSH